MALTGQTLKDAGGALFAGLSSADLTRVSRSLVQRTMSFQFSDAATPGTILGDSPLWRVDAPNGVRILSAYVTTGIAVTASDAVYATPTLNQRRASAPLSAVLVASINTAVTVAPFSGNLAAFIPQAMTLTSTTANQIVAFGDVVTFALAKLSTGTALTAAAASTGDKFQVHFTYEEL